MTADWQREIAELHEFFEGWLGGSLADTDESFGRFEGAIVPGFTFIGPDARVIGREDLVAGLRAAHGSRPAIRIRIENPRLRHETADLLVATYEEWQECTPTVTGRLSTVVFGTSHDCLEWMHVHETWIRPPAGGATA